jgi:hypothetical protein
VQNGTVVANRMINLTVANNKLVFTRIKFFIVIGEYSLTMSIWVDVSVQYYRSIGIIAQFASSSLERAEHAMLKAIYRFVRLFISTFPIHFSG